MAEFFAGDVGKLILQGAIGAGGAALQPGEENRLDPFVNIPVGGQHLQPIDVLGLGLTGVTRAGEALTNRAEAPISLGPAVVQPPPILAGGGLPMPIGVTGIDPAFRDPSILVDRGQTFQDPFLSLGGFDKRAESQAGIDLSSDEAIRGLESQIAALIPNPEGAGLFGSQAPARPPVQTAPAAPGPQDPLSEAQGAIDLLGFAAQEGRRS